MNDITLRPATPQDSALVYELKKRALGPCVIAAHGGWNEEEQQRMHERQFRPAGSQIVMQDGRVVGMLSADEHADHIHLRQLFILPEAQNRGIGTRLLGLVLERARTVALPVRLQVLKVNKRAQAFYVRHGFRVVGETETHEKMECAANQK
jgi:ribosomal protein S18 acetylase RimI-like enzyme